MTGRPGARIAALDIGGSTIAAAVCEAGGRVVAATSVATGRFDGAEVVLGRAVGVLGALLDAGAGPIEVLGVASIVVPRAGSTDLAATIRAGERWRWEPASPVRSGCRPSWSTT